MTSSGLPSHVRCLRLDSLPPRDVTFPYLPSPLSPESPLEPSSAPVLTPPTTPLSAAGVLGHPVIGNHASNRIHPLQQPQSHSYASRHPLSLQSHSHMLHPSTSGMSHASTSGYTHSALHLMTPSHSHSQVGGAVAAENKRAQNRRSAKRFRDAQKQRWKALQDENIAQRAEIERLTSILQAAGISSYTQTSAVTNGASSFRPSARSILPPQSPSNKHGSEAQPCKMSGVASSRSYMSIAALVDEPDKKDNYAPQDEKNENGFDRSLVESQNAAEAQLYYQVLAAASPLHRDSPYAAELGILLRCFNARTGKVLRGETLSAMYDGMSSSHVELLRRAVRSETPVALAYHRHGKMLNAVVGPSSDGSLAVVAEFRPFATSSESA